MEESELKLIKHASFDWLKQNIQFIQAGEDIEVATPLIGAGFEFDEDNSEIYQIVDLGNMAQTLSDLTQLQVALTYLAS